MKNRKYNGYTLLESLLYVALVATLIPIISIIYSTLIEAKQKNDIENSLLFQAEFAAFHIDSHLKKNLPIEDITIEENNIVIIDQGLETYKLTSNIDSSEVTFTQLQNDTVRYTITLIKDSASVEITSAVQIRDQ